MELLAALAVTLVPPATFLWTSPQPLRDLYGVFAIAVAVACALGLVLALAKRLHDQNLNGLWAFPVLVLLPWGLLIATQVWVAHLYETRHSVASAAYYNIAILVWLAIVLLLAFRRSQPTERFGPRLDTRALLRPHHPASILIFTALAVVVPVSLYAGFLQDGLWVGRAEYTFFGGPVVRTPGGGDVIASCGNAKGVSASAQQDTQIGFNRDAVGGTWNLVVRPDGSLDIQTYSDLQVLSYREDGFTITPSGLRLTDYGFLTRDVDNFMVVAQSSSESGAVKNVTVMSFVRDDYRYYALISASRTMAREDMLTGKFARASSYLLMADCTVNQESIDPHQ